MLCHLKVASTECSEDEPFQVYKNYLGDEAQCVDICETYANIQDIGCTFSRWIKGQVGYSQKIALIVCDVFPFESTNQVSGGLCILYNEAFSDYLANCQLLSGPPDVSDCPVDHPEENSCAGMR